MLRDVALPVGGSQNDLRQIFCRTGILIGGEGRPWSTSLAERRHTQPYMALGGLLRTAENLSTLIHRSRRDRIVR